MAVNPLANFEEYIAGFPDDVQEHLKGIRAAIKKISKKLEEKISYNMPAFTYDGKNLIYYSAFKKHIGLYPAPSVKEFKKDFEPYKTSGKGTIQFPLHKPMPIALIKKIVRYRISELKNKK